MDIKIIWDKLLEDLEKVIGKDAIELWILSINPFLINENTLKLELPNSIVYDKIKNEGYDLKILEILKNITQKDFNLEFSISIKHEIKKELPKENIIITKINENIDTRLNPSYIFDNIIEGDSNRFAIRMAKSTALNPGQTNPFFLYSLPGMGKTHILHAIGNEILRNKRNAKILYASADTFVDEFIKTLGDKTFDSFRNKYRNLDCLLLDDIQFIVKKERSEEEFFHTFNALFELKKQIVVTSDKTPNDMELNERLISRFRVGIIADIKPPEYELRVAILNQENKFNNFNLPSDIINFIAEKIEDSVRSLKGCITLVAHYCQNNNIYPSIDRVEEIIKDYINPTSSERKFVEINTIKEVVANEYKISVKDFSLKTRVERISFARQIAMYLACTLTNKSLPEIGEAFDKDHSTVIYSRDKIIQLMHQDPFFSKQINDIITKISNKKG